MKNGCRPLTNEELSKMINSFDNLRDKCMLILGVKTGFRISELLSIKIKDILEYNDVGSFITVKKSKTKGKVASRTVPVSSELKNALKEYIQSLPSTQVYLFESQKGNKLSRVQAWRVIKQAALSNQLKGKIATHSARKTFAEKIYQKLDKDLIKTQRALGHVSIQSTVSYLSFTEEEIDNAIMDI